MDWLKKRIGKKEPEPPQAVPEPEPEPVPPPVKRKQKKPKDQTFTEIGGSPVPGFTLRQVLRGHTSWIGRIAWSPDGAYLASPSDDKTVRIWDAATGVCVRSLQGHTGRVYSQTK